MVLLSLQFAVQPILTKRYAPKTMIRSTYVLAQDLTRILIAASCLTLTGSWTTAVQHWTWRTALWTAGVPSLLYALQNYCSLMAYQNLTPITYNVLNQTKTLSAAFWCFLLLQQRQSGPQMLALGILLLSALVMENVVRVPFLETAAAATKPDETSSTTSTRGCCGCRFHPTQKPHCDRRRARPRRQSHFGPRRRLDPAIAAAADGHGGRQQFALFDAANVRRERRGVDRVAAAGGAGTTARRRRPSWIFLDDWLDGVHVATHSGQLGGRSARGSRDEIQWRRAQGVCPHCGHVSVGNLAKYIFDRFIGPCG